MYYHVIDKKPLFTYIKAMMAVICEWLETGDSDLHAIDSIARLFVARHGEPQNRARSCVRKLFLWSAPERALHDLSAFVP